MSLPERVIDRLRELMKEVTASVIIGGRSTGTAFFIDDGLLLTCEHVIKDHTTCEIAVVGRRRRTAAVLGTPDKAADLALLSTTVEPDDPPQPCVALDDLLPHGQYLVAGFPREDDVDTGLEIFAVTGHPRTGVDEADQLVQIEAGRIITWGMSGGPVLSAESGAVVGVTRSSKDPTDARGGAAIPMSRVANAFEVVRNLQRRQTPAVRRWRDALERERWQALGKPWNMEACIDLQISGTRTQWEISMGDAAGVRHVLTGSDLGVDVAEALFRWAAQRRRLHGKAEVELLGRLLAKGLIPTSVEEHLRKVTGADVVHVRLHIAPGNDLADIPWELAAVPGQPTKFLATDNNFRLSRVVDDTRAEATRREPMVGPVDVLAVLAQPRDWTFAKVYGRKGDKPYRWPELEDIDKNLRTSINGDPFKLNLMVCPQPGDVSDQLESGLYSVFHYAGVGKLLDGEPLMAYVDADGQQESWMEASRVLDLAADNGVRLVVLEFMLPPEGQEFDQLTPSKLGRLVRGGIDAVVLTQQPVHASQCMAFNTSFYRELKRCQSVEGAIQRARKDLANNRPVEDDAGFGWFSVVTSPAAGVVIVASPERTDRRELTIGERGAGLSAVPVPVETDR